MSRLTPLLLILAPVVVPALLPGCAKTIGDDCYFVRRCTEEGGHGGEGGAGEHAGGSHSGGTSQHTNDRGGTENQGGANSGGSAGTEAGSGGSTESPDACGNACIADTPICDETDASCVECIRTEHCQTGVCDPSARTCVGCLGSEDCTTPSPYCDTSAQQCVECLSSKNCSSPTASKCVQGKCEACVTDDDCAGVPGKSVCDSGECVECTGKNYTKCGSSNGMRFVCDSLKRECSKTAFQQSAGPCQPCVSDAQCKPGQMCVLDKFGSPAQEIGYFCHWIQGADAPGAPKDCPTQGRPFVAVTSDAVSIDGGAGDVCVLAVSTCTAMNQFRSADCSKDGKPDDSLCGVAPGKDSKCAAFGQGFRCTTTCLSDDDCDVVTCDKGASPKICKFQ